MLCASGTIKYLAINEHVNIVKSFNFIWRCIFLCRKVPWVTAFLFLFSFALSIHVKASPSEFELKAAYLYRIIKFIEWPDEVFTSASSPLHLCVVGNSKLPNTFYQLNGHTVNNRRLKISKLNKSKLKDIISCNLVYVSFRDAELMSTFIANITNLPIVTVSDVPDFVHRQGMIGFVNKSEYITIEVNLGVANAANIDIRAQLLEVASHIINPVDTL